MFSTSSSNAVAVTLVFLLVVTIPTDVVSFQLHRTAPLNRRATTKSAFRTFTYLHNENPNKESDIPREEEIVGDQYEGSVDCEL